MRLPKMLAWLAAGALGLAAAAVVLLLIASGPWFLPSPPPASVETPLPRLVVEADGTSRIGESFAFARGGIQACALTGPPRMRGAAMGRLRREGIFAVEEALLGKVRACVPNPAARWLWARMLMVRNRDLDDHVPVWVQREVAGLVEHSEDRFPQYGPHFVRHLNYLAAHDLIQDYAAVPHGIGCTAFGATTRMTGDGTVLLARNFDIEDGEALRNNLTVLRFAPPDGYAHLSVAWPGMFGVLSGVNEAGLAVALLAARSRDTAGIGVPVSVLARRVLTEAATLDQAIAMIRGAEVFADQTFLIGSGAEDAFAVVEKTPLRTGVRGRRSRIVTATNHFLSPALREDPENIRTRALGPSEARMQRLTWLTNEAAGELDLARGIRILRDRRGRDGTFVGYGHRNAIDNLHAVHSVVFELTSRTAWVSEGPHTLGAYRPFRLDRFGGDAAPPAAGADPLLTGGRYDDIVRYRRGLRRAEAHLETGRHREALAVLVEIRLYNLKHYRSYLLAGRALEALGRRDEARYNYRIALNRQPAYARERAFLRDRLAGLASRESP